MPDEMKASHVLVPPARADGRSAKLNAEDPAGPYGFFGRHILADLYGIDAEALNDAPYLCSLLEAGIVRSGATLIKTVDFVFQPSGVTLLMLLAESHVSLHTYPDESRAFFDAFTCGTTCDPHQILRMFCDEFPQCTWRMTALMRGDPQTERLSF
ncbi:adenosylmethionine decarboxylase [Pandoraea pnomenusa]|uniref:adenosylmethionine decarboxylase n=1 Tax=Pandoraea pnomenusa TaxID=93220 RepID=UPI00334290BB